MQQPHIVIYNPCMQYFDCKSCNKVRSSKYVVCIMHCIKFIALSPFHCFQSQNCLSTITQIEVVVSTAESVKKIMQLCTDYFLPIVAPSILVAVGVVFKVPPCIGWTLTVVTIIIFWPVVAAFSDVRDIIDLATASS